MNLHHYTKLHYLEINKITGNIIKFCMEKIESKCIKSFLYYVPYAVLSCMTFPAIFYSTNNTYTAIIGTTVALGASFFKLKLIYVVIITVCVVFGFSFIFY